MILIFQQSDFTGTTRTVGILKFVQQIFEATARIQDEHYQTGLRKMIEDSENKLAVNWGAHILETAGAAVSE